MDETDIAIIGAGVVGLAVAAELVRRFPRASLVLFERHPTFGQETSGRNSEVIHAGIYYPEGSLKASLCVEGKRLLYEFCKSHNVPYLRMGKVIVANSSRETETLAELYSRGVGNGVHDLEMLNRAQLNLMEPEIHACQALYSPSSGVVDTHTLMKRLEVRALEGNAVIVYRHAVSGLECFGGGNTVLFQDPDGRQGAVSCGWVINSTGLSSDRVAGLPGIDVDSAGYRLYPCKGEYFSLPHRLSGRVRHLLYPPPYADMRGLGIHLTKALDGRLRAGPSAEYVNDIDYSVAPGHAQKFFDALSEYLPFIKRGDLQPDTAGIRPKLQGPGMPAKDFVVCRETRRGFDRLINLVGIESPGLTACMAIARKVADMVARG